MSDGTQPAFTIVVPTFDRQSLLDEALESVRGQTLDDWECIVVDDASPHPPSLPGDPRFRLLRQPRNAGVAEARNRGIGAARGRALTFLDDDDCWYPERLAIAQEGLRLAPVTLCSLTTFTGEVRPLRHLDGDVHDVILDDMAPSLGQVAVLREACLPLDPQFKTVEDLDWWLRTTQHARVSTIRRPGWMARVHAGPRNGTGTRQRIADSYLLLRVHAEYFDRHPRATAFRLARIGVMHMLLSEHREAVAALLASLRTSPSRFAARQLVRASGTALAAVPQRLGRWS